MPPKHQYNETAILGLVAEGDSSAFAKLYHSHRNKVYDVALRLTHEIPLAEEIVADVFMIVWERREKLSDITNFQAYLYTITRNKSYRVMKNIAKRFLTTELSEDIEYRAENTTEDQLMDKEYSLLLKQAIERLPPQQRKVFQLIKQQDKKRDEAAEILEIHPQTVKYHLAEAMKNIRTFFRPYLEIFIGIILLLFH